jgi:hypothetical protein
MAADNGSLPSRSNEHGLGLGIRTRNYKKKQGEIPVIFFSLCTHFSIVDSVTITLMNIATCLPASICPPPLLLFAQLVSLPSSFSWPWQ